ncbi:hypothetical protein [Aquimarina sediminis]|uniref:hypothetical protein n=1 Tax=Aquimarina sediminis TaxID=2070536 RepID=UPI000CA03F9C|nr:hypothetical protein [Aquimarina sediminis]
MKNRIIAFASTLMLTTLILSCSSDDDNTPAAPEGVVSAERYKDVKSANREINSVVQGAFNNPSRTSRNFISKNNDCTTVEGAVGSGNGGTITINFGADCQSPDGKPISGKIIVTFTVKEEMSGAIVQMNYTLENFSFDGITVSGTSVATITISEQGGQKFVSTSDYLFAWSDGLRVTSKDTTAVEIVMNQDTFDFYTLVTLDTSSEFNNGSVFTSKTTTPLRLESGCEYVVSGTIVTTEDSSTSTLEYGDGTCDNIAILTDADGNETTIDLSIEENFVL